MIILPTMNRPDRLQLALNTMMECGISSPGVVFVNGPLRRAEYEQVRLPGGWHMIHLDENRGVCGVLNLGFRLFPNEPNYALYCDDEHVFTQGFDKILAEAAGDWFVANANDGWKSSWRCWSFVTIGGKLARAMGHIALPGLWHYYWDDWIETIANELHLRRFCAQIQTKHAHWEKSETDDLTYQTGRSKWGEDAERFKQWKANEWPAVKERLLRVIP